MNRSKRSMGKGNGKTEGNLDLEHELPAAEGGEETPSTSSTASAGRSNDLRGGLELIYRQFQDTLQKLGVQPIESVGKPFDPRVHEAVEMVDTSDAPDHQVLDEFHRGYNYKGRLLRPAMVRVARNSGQ